MNFLFTALNMGAGIACVFVAITFINGQFMPQTFSGIYEFVSNSMARTVLVCVTIIIPANYLIAKGYTIGGQAIGGSLYVVALVLGMVITATIVEGMKLNMHIIGGIIGMMFMAIWVVYGMNNSVA